MAPATIGTSLTVFSPGQLWQLAPGGNGHAASCPRECRAGRWAGLDTSENHLDVVDVTVTLTPAAYAWDFGDDAGGSWRPDSHASFPDRSGLGQAFTDPYHPSSVVHRYSQSSFKVFDQGGFLVQLSTTWTASGHVVATRDGAVVQDGAISLPTRAGNYSARYQVRESQPILRRSLP